MFLQSNGFFRPLLFDPYNPAELLPCKYLQSMSGGMHTSGPVPLGLQQQVRQPKAAASLAQRLKAGPIPITTDGYDEAGHTPASIPGAPTLYVPPPKIHEAVPGARVDVAGKSEESFPLRELVRCQVHYFAGFGQGRSKHESGDSDRQLDWGHADFRRALSFILDQVRRYEGDYSVVLVGHSWGSNTALRLSRALARRGVKVRAVLTLDPVRRASILPARTAHPDHLHVNVAQEGTGLDAIAGIPLLGYFLSALAGSVGLMTGKLDPYDWEATVAGQRGRIRSADKNISSPAPHVDVREYLGMARQELPPTLAGLWSMNPLPKPR